MHGVTSLKGMVANPGVVQLANGTLLIAYRGKDDRGIGMAVSSSWDSPFTRLNGGAARCSVLNHDCATN
jgi:hypothetical protein